MVSIYVRIYTYLAISFDIKPRVRKIIIRNNAKKGAGSPGKISAFAWVPVIVPRPKTAGIILYT